GPKFELVGGRIDERLLAARNFDRVGARVERGELVSALNRRQVQFVAEADVERQLGGDLPIIMEVVAGTEGLRVVERLPKIAVGLRGQAQQQVGDGMSREAPVKTETTASE